MNNSIEKRKGTMLGLTLAETMLLILFLLLIILSFLLKKQKQFNEDLTENTSSYTSTLNRYGHDEKLKKVVNSLIENADIITNYIENKIELSEDEEELILGDLPDDLKVILDKNGNPIGYKTPSGEILDFDGHIIPPEELKELTDVEELDLINLSDDFKVVLDEQGKPIGYADSTGKLINKSGDIIGHVDQDGTIHKTQEDLILGNLSDNFKVVLDKNGNPVGYKNPLGEILDFDGHIIPPEELKELTDVEELDLINLSDDFKVVLDKNGNPIGYADTTGKVIDKFGTIIGQIDENGQIHKTQRIDIEKNINKKIIGVLDQNEAFDFKGKYLGKIGNQNEIINSNKEYVGKAIDNALILRNKNDVIIGYLNGLNHIKSNLSETIGILDETGTVYSVSDNIIATIPNLHSLVFDEENNILGFVHRNNIVRNKNGTEIGVVDYTGNVYNSNGDFMGKTGKKFFTISHKNHRIFAIVNDENLAFSVSSKTIWGKVDPTKKNLNNNNIIEPDETSAVLVRSINQNNILGYYTKEKFFPITKIKKDGNYTIVEDTLKDDTSQVIGKLSEKIHLGFKNKQAIGYLTKDGHFIDWNDNKIGIVDNAGDVYSSNFKKMGELTLYYKTNPAIAKIEIHRFDDIPSTQFPLEQRIAFLKEEKVIGYIDDNHNVKNVSNEIIGTISKNGKIIGNISGIIPNYTALIEAEKETSNIAKHIINALKKEAILAENKEKSTDEITNKILSYQKRNEELQQEIVNLKGWQQKKIEQERKDAEKLTKKGNRLGNGGRDKPSCLFKEEENGEIIDDYIYYLVMTKDGIIAYESVSKKNKSFFETIPHLTTQKILSLKDFETEANKIYQYSVKSNCRFYVKYCRSTDLNDADLSDKTRRLITGRFYGPEHIHCKVPSL